MSRIAALEEVTGGAALAADPDDLEGLAAALRRIAGDDALAADLSRRGRGRARRFGWKAFAEANFAAYRMALEGG